MQRQVITVNPDGSIFGLQHKRGQGVDLRKLGHAKVKRETLIEWDEARQAWTIRWTTPERDEWGQLEWDHGTFRRAGVDHRAHGGFVYPSTVPDAHAEWAVFFDDYEDAVAAEVAVIQALQVAGKLAA
jgi:hypothetical protein